MDQDPHDATSEQSEGGPAGERAAPFDTSRERVSDGIAAITVGQLKGRSSYSCPQRPGPKSRQKPETGLPCEEAEAGERQPEEAAPEEAAPEEAAPSEESMEPSPADLAGTFGAAAGPQSAAPYMIGDFFGGAAYQATIVRSFTFDGLMYQPGSGATFYTVLPDEDLTRVALHDISPNDRIPPFPIANVNDASSRLGGAPLQAVPAGGTFLGGTTTGEEIDTGYPQEYTSQFQMAYVVTVPSPGSGGGVGRMKIAENTSPMPRDRLIFDYGYFDNVPLAPGGVSVNRFTLGFEKTFLDGDMSFEFKAPMASTVDSTVVQNVAINERSGEFGNLELAVKMLLRQTETWAFSGGLQLGLPTADDTRVVLQDGTPLLAIRNDAVHLGPFFGALWTPNERLFSHGFLQCDVASAGNAVLVNRDGWRLSEAGRLNDATLLTLDWGIGYWAVRNSCRHRSLTGLAGTAELHWSRSLQSADAVAADHGLSPAGARRAVATTGRSTCST